MKRIITFLCFLGCLNVSSQEFAPLLKPLPTNPQPADFAFLKEELKGRRIVMLGELTHFDGNVFEVKTQIVEYLVREMGFTTIAFESGIYDLWDAQQKIVRGEDVEQAFQNSLFPIWGRALEFQPFIKFYEANKNRLKLFGFDVQLTGDNSPENLSSALYAYCKVNKLKSGLKQEDFALLLESVTKSGIDEEDISYKDYQKELSRLYSQISVRPQNEETFYWKQIIKSLIVLGEDTYNPLDIASAFSTTAADNARDKQMAENLLAYIKLHPEEKIICWGANAHFVNDISSISTPVLKEFIPMGSYLKNELKDNVYSLAAVTATDSVHILNKWHKTLVQANSFESFLKGKKARHVFISSKQPEMNKMKFNRLFSPVTFTEANLAELHDGYLYFDETAPSTIIAASGGKKNRDELMDGFTAGVLPDGEVGAVPKADYNLEEIVVYSRQTPYQIVEKAIKNKKLNYPDDGFSSTLYTRIFAEINDATLLDLEFIASQYDHGYVSYTDRSIKKLMEIRWNTREFFKTETLREYHSLVYNSPIQYAPVLSNRKYRKFDLTLEEVKVVNGEEVYVILFSSPRDHSTYTKRVFLSNYTGYLYINTKNHAVVKLMENWEVTDFPDSFRTGYGLSGPYSKYVSKEYLNETTVSEFSKVNGLYYLAYSENTVTGKLKDAGGNSVPFEIDTESTWYDFITVNPIKIRYSDEQHLFERVKYNGAFWKDYKVPE